MFRVRRLLSQGQNLQAIFSINIFTRFHFHVFPKITPPQDGGLFPEWVFLGHDQSEQVLILSNNQIFTELVQTTAKHSTWVRYLAFPVSSICSLSLTSTGTEYTYFFN